MELKSTFSRDSIGKGSPNPNTGLIQKLVQLQIWFNPKSRFYENKNLYIFKMRTFSNGLSPCRSSSDECWSLECQAWAKPEQRRLGALGPFSKDLSQKERIFAKDLWYKRTFNQKEHWARGPFWEVDAKFIVSSKFGT